MRAALLPVCGALALACTAAETRRETPAPTADAAVTLDALPDAAVALVEDAPEHAPEPAKNPPLLAELAGKVVLHAGDSMVGGQAGLTRGLELKFKEAGVKAYKSDSWVSANLSMFHQQPHFGDLLKKHGPDLVLVTLGANDSFTSAPELMIPHVKAIVAKIGQTPCLWISPPPFTKAEFPHSAENFQKFVDMLAANVAPCRFFDTRKLDESAPIPRAKDKIHPTDKGGLQWADAVWAQEFGK